MRLFVGVFPPVEVVDDLRERVAALRVGRAAAGGVNSRLVPPDRWHLTLAFLGDVPDDRLPAARTAVQALPLPPTNPRPRTRRTAVDPAAVDPAAVDPGVADPGVADPVVGAIGHTPPRLRLAGGGRFGRGRFTVLWVGVEGDLAGLHRTADVVRRELRRARLPFDRKPLRPHLTLARPGDRLSRADIDADVADLAAYRGPEWTVDTIDLVRSHLGPDPSYDRLLSVRLA